MTFVVGLKYQDAVVNFPAVELAASRLPWHLQEARLVSLCFVEIHVLLFIYFYHRDRRMIRAADISMRRKYLKKEQQNVDVLDVRNNFSLKEFV